MFSWATTKQKNSQQGHPDGDMWAASECDVSIRPGWFYHANEDAKVKTPDELLEIYYKVWGVTV